MALRDLEMPPWFSVLYGGQYEERLAGQRDFSVAIAMALVLVYILMAAQFERFVDPLIVMLALPMALIGVVPTLLLTGTTVNIQLPWVACLGQDDGVKSLGVKSLLPAGRTMAYVATNPQGDTIRADREAAAMAESSAGGTGVTRRTALLAAAAACKEALSPRRSIAGTRPATSGGAMDLDRFVAECVAAGAEVDPQAAVREVLARAVATPKAVLAALGEPKQAGIRPLHRSKTLTIFSATWTPQMNLMPHNHLMWALIGIYTGREDNIMWRRAPGPLEAFAAKALFEGDVATLPADVIHSVTNPLPRFTGGIHIYGGDFFDTARSQWDPETLREEPSDGATIREMFERENARRRCVAS